jgi:hypothetical protein
MSSEVIIPKINPSYVSLTNSSSILNFLMNPIINNITTLKINLFPTERVVEKFIISNAIDHIINNNPNIEYIEMIATQPNKNCELSTATINNLQYQFPIKHMKISH